MIYIYIIFLKGEEEQELKLNGFVNVSSHVDVNAECLSLYGQKPNFEVGSSTRLQCKSKATTKTAGAVWKLDLDDAESELIDTDSLLDAADLKKPDLLAAKYDCGESQTTDKKAKKKACKDCTCGLAQELEEGVVKERTQQQQQQQQNEPSLKSSCGSCYLGDAFRCASCPYAGLPAFKPGEKVQLGDMLIKADI